MKEIKNGARGYSVQNIAHENTKSQKEKDRIANYEKNIRNKMQVTIKNRVLEDKSKKEIIEELRQNEDYKQFEKYFDGYIDNFMNKKEKLKPKKQISVVEEEMER